MALKLSTQTLGSLNKTKGNTPISNSPKSSKIQGSSPVKVLQKPVGAVNQAKTNQKSAAASPTKSSKKQAPVIKNYIYEAHLDGSIVQNLLSKESSGKVIQRHLKNWDSPMKFKESPSASKQKPVQHKEAAKGKQPVQQKEASKASQQKPKLNNAQGAKQKPQNKKAAPVAPKNYVYEANLDGSGIQSLLSKEGTGVVVMRKLNWSSPMKQSPAKASSSSPKASNNSPKASSNSPKKSIAPASKQAAPNAKASSPTKQASSSKSEKQSSPTKQAPPNKWASPVKASIVLSKNIGSPTASKSSSPQKSAKCPALSPSECARRERGESFSESNFSDSVVQRRLSQ